MEAKLDSLLQLLQQSESRRASEMKAIKLTVDSIKLTAASVSALISSATPTLSTALENVSPTAETPTEVSATQLPQPFSVQVLGMLAPAKRSTECPGNGTNVFAFPNAQLKATPKLLDEKFQHGDADLVVSLQPDSEQAVISTSSGPRLVPMQPMFSGVLDIDVVGVVDITKLADVVWHETDEVDVLAMVDIVDVDPGEDQRPPWPPPQPVFLYLPEYPEFSVQSTIHYFMASESVNWLGAMDGHLLDFPCSAFVTTCLAYPRETGYYYQLKETVLLNSIGMSDSSYNQFACAEFLCIIIRRPNYLNYYTHCQEEKYFRQEQGGDAIQGALHVFQDKFDAVVVSRKELPGVDVVTWSDLRVLIHLSYAYWLLQEHVYLGVGKLNLYQYLINQVVETYLKVNLLELFARDMASKWCSSANFQSITTGRPNYFTYSAHCSDAFSSSFQFIGSTCSMYTCMRIYNSRGSGEMIRQLVGHLLGECFLNSIYCPDISTINSLLRTSKMGVQVATPLVVWMPVDWVDKANPNWRSLCDPEGCLLALCSCEKWLNTSEPTALNCPEQLRWLSLLLAYASMIWLVAWAGHGLELSSGYGYGQAHSQEGRTVTNQAAISGSVHVVHDDYYIAFINKISIGYDDYPDQMYYYRDGHRCDAGNIKEVHAPWDPGKSTLCHHPKTSAWGQAEFQEGRNVMTPVCAPQIGLLSRVHDDGLGPDDPTGASAATYTH